MPRVLSGSRTESTLEHIWSRAELASILGFRTLDEGDHRHVWMDDNGELHERVVTTEVTGRV